ncbi:adenylate cyclase [Roseiarcus fermentans]|uniref:Adenylate cyclase n=1 Tax=Roseiarcus fermentans TaxID=1473586 RepID=A0A366FC48_9HYPH|nr:adenylate/guanylate cyclase domain-containing protein [Roseiarcus fermentans]RBP12253.1 adenylate cyclase [Roseiarcus fermentans]
MRPTAGRAIGVRRLRLACGLVLFAYVTLHYLNHALGNLSVEAMETGLAVQKLIWQSAAGALLLYAALVTHMGLGFWALYQRRQFRMTRLEATQLALGLTIPFLLTDHVVGARVALSLFGADKGYAQELVKFASPIAGWLQATLLLVVWIHGCIGIHFWLALKPFYPRIRNVLLSGAVLLPTLALLGFLQGERQISPLLADPTWRARILSPAHVGTAADGALLLAVRTDTLIGLAGVLAGVLLVRALRRWRERRVGSIRLTFPDRTIRARRGLSVLEASLITGAPLAHVCGGRGRCSTCRIRVLGDRGDLPAASEAEQTVLDRVRAEAGVRLACQLRPTRDLALLPLLPPHVSIADVRRGPARSGEERYAAVMFVDMRGSTRLAEKRLPYDTVFLINQFLNAVSSAVIEAGGQPNQVLGDGLLAVFGLEQPPDEACRAAIAACARIAGAVDRLNDALAHGPVEPIRFGVGVNAGLVIAGEIGYERHAQFTVIGDTVNVAARLQDLTKRLACEVLMSEEVYRRAALAALDLPAHEVDARGRTGTVMARSAKKASDLAGLMPAAI